MRSEPGPPRTTKSCSATFGSAPCQQKLTVKTPFAQRAGDGLHLYGHEGSDNRVALLTIVLLAVADCRPDDSSVRPRAAVGAPAWRAGWRHKRAVVDTPLRRHSRRAAFEY